jgi:hypothetical protein
MYGISWQETCWPVTRQYFSFHLDSIFWLQSQANQVFVPLMLHAYWLWTIAGNMFGECHIPCMLKASFVDFEKKVGAFCNCYKRLSFSSLPNSPYLFNCSQKSLTRLTHSFPNFYIVFIYYWICTHLAFSRNTAWRIGR